MTEPTDAELLALVFITPQPTQAVPPAGREPQCWCLTCRPMRFEDPCSIRMALCPACGNKRCPKANDHRNTCTGSNEPVAWRYADARGHFRYVGYKPSRDMAAEYPLLKPIRLYLHPSPPGGMVGGWTALPGALPEPGVPVLLDIGKKYPIRALWAAKHTVQAANDDTDWGEYDEATDEYWCPEGWYEWNQNEDNHWCVTETPRAWMPLPPTSAEGVEHG